MKEIGGSLNERRQNDQARREMLSSIREHLAASAPLDRARDFTSDRARHGREQQHQNAKHKSPASVVSHKQTASPVERFRRSLEAVSGHSSVARNELEAAETIHAILEQVKARRVAISNSPLVERVMESVSTEAAILRNIDASELFDCDLGITGAQWAVAETGTLVLESDAERHRLTSLVPPVHIALIEAETIRESLEEVLGSLSEAGRDGLNRAVTFITGPSRTSDIELTLAIGVHGPAEVYVIILER